VRERRPSSLLAALVLTLAVVPAGCRDVEPRPRDASPASAEQAPVRDRMLAVSKRSELPRQFPIEVPVIEGSIETTSMSTAEWSWIYTVKTKGGAAEAARWYERAYASSGWAEDQRSAELVEGKAVIDLTFTKGSAQSVVHLEDVSGGACRVRASMGIGVPAPRTY
jgi:hypothetical protein